MSTMWPPEMVKMCSIPSCFSIFATIWPLEIMSGAGAGAAFVSGAVSTAVSIMVRLLVDVSEAGFHVPIAALPLSRIPAFAGVFIVTDGLRHTMTLAPGLSQGVYYG